MAAEELVEWVVRWASEPPRDARLADARHAFEQRTAPIEIDQRDYEARIGHFLDWFICEFAEDGQPPPVQAFAAAHPELPQGARARLAGLLRSQRALLQVVRTAPQVVLVDLLRGGRFSLREAGGRLAEGEILDGRVAWDGSDVALARGRVFHPADSHGPIRTLVADPQVRAVPHDQLLDALLAMRDRLQRFTRVRAEHLYTAQAIGKQAFSAPWNDKAHGASEETPWSKGP